MGNQAVVIIRLDGWDEIKRCPGEFVAHLEKEFNRAVDRMHYEGADIPCGAHWNPARLVAVHHSDSTVVVASGGGTGSIVGRVFRWSWKTRQEMVKDLLEAIKKGD